MCSFSEGFFHFLEVFGKMIIFVPNCIAMKKETSIFILGLLLTLLSARAATIESEPFVTMTRFAADDESIQGRPTSIMQDYEGYIWVSSLNGINRYDGYRWTKYKSRSGKNSVLTTNRFNNMWENSCGNIWCSTVTNIYLFDKKEEVFSDVQQIIDSLAGHRVHVNRVWTLAKGVTWMLSEDSFLFRLDDNNLASNSQLVHYNVEPSPSSEVYGVTSDRQGNEWILHSLGTYRYGDNAPISKVVFRHMAVADDSPWFVSNNGRQIANYTGGTLSFIDMAPENCRVSSFQLIGDSLLLASTNKGLFRTSIRSRETTLVSSDIILNATVDSHGILWGQDEHYNIVRLTSNDDFLHAESRCVPFSEGPTEQDTHIRFFEDGDGRMWFLPYHNSNIRYYNPRTETFNRPLAQEDFAINTSSLLIDRQGNVWYQSDRSIDMLTLHNTPFHADNRFPGHEVRSQLIDRKGRRWYGLRDDIIVLCDSSDTELRRFSIEGTMYCMYEQSDGTVWVGSRSDGLYRLSPRGDGNDFDITHYLHDDNDITSLSHNSIYSICEDSRHHIWIGTFGGGLNLWNEGPFVHQQNRLGYNSELPQTIRFICEIKPDVLAVGSREGLYTFNTRFDKPEDIVMFHNAKRSFDDTSISDNDVMSVLMTRDSSLYISTQSGGVCQMVAGNLLSSDIQFKCISKDDGLASDVAYGIVEDLQGFLWVSSERALSRINPDDGAITIYDDSSFPTEVVFSEGVPLRNGSTLFFGTMQGIVSVNPSELRTDVYVPPLVVDSRPASSRDNRSATIHFAALDFRSKKHLMYAYRLDDVDADWTTTADNTVTYVNLPPGHHLFHVRSTNADGQWTPNEQVLPLYIRPRLYERGWGMALIMLAILTLITLAVYQVMRLYRLRHSLTVEQELTDMKLRFFTDISHELRTPLTLVDGPVSEVLDDPTLSDQSRYYLEVVQRNVRRMLNLVNQILDFRKLQNHKMSLLIEPLDVQDTLAHIMQNFDEMALQHHITFTLQAPPDIPVLWADRDKVEKIFFNLLTNAFKYTDDGKAISVVVSRPAADSLAIAVSDEGIGIRRDDIPKLFSRFETVVNDNYSKPSSGIGLSLVKQFTELHHATIGVDSKVGQGSTFTVTFPLGCNHFAADSYVEFLAADTADSSSTVSEPISDDQEAPNPLSQESINNPVEDDRPKILIVEDNDELRDFMYHILADTCQVTLAVNGDDGLRKGREVWPDLIITDIMMPVMDGFEMVRHIKEDSDIYAVPIIVLTAKGTLDDRIHGVEMGVDDYVLKPFSASYLKARVIALLEQRRRLHQRFMQMLTAGDKPLARRCLEPDMPVITPADELFVQEVMAFMERNMDNAELTIDQFASAVNLGRTVFYNKLKATVGLTPVDFVQEMRIKRAVQLMATGNFSISEIAYRTGFNDPKYFSRCFKKHLGETPTDYQRKLLVGEKPTSESPD